MNELFNYEILNFFVSIRNSFLDNFFIIITDLGSLELYLIFISFFFFIFEDKITLKLLFLLIFSYLINTLIKNTLKLPRPNEEIIQPIYKESGGGFGFPSGHSQNSTVLWIGLYLIFKKRYLIIISSILIILISISRLYLGLHFLIDVLGGILIGIMIIFIFFKYIGRLIEKYFIIDFWEILIISSFLYILSFIIKDYAFILISLSGILIGVKLTKKFKNYKLDLKKIFLRVLIGYPIIFILIYCIKITNFNLIYLIIGLWISFISRTIFNKLKI